MRKVGTPDEERFYPLRVGRYAGLSVENLNIDDKSELMANNKSQSKNPLFIELKKSIDRKK